jgi:hypothetical protein
MPRAKTFFYVSLGVLALAIAFHFGATSAQGQAPGNPIVAAMSAGQGGSWAIAANGDVYTPNGPTGATWNHTGNVFTGSPISTTPETWGKVKATYRR